MSDEDDGADAWAHQMELEQRQREEEVALNRCRKLTCKFRDEMKAFERDTDEHHKRMKELTL